MHFGRWSSWSVDSLVIQNWILLTHLFSRQIFENFWFYLTKIFFWILLFFLWLITNSTNPLEIMWFNYSCLLLSHHQLLTINILYMLYNGNIIFKLMYSFVCFSRITLPNCNSFFFPACVCNDIVINI